MHVAGLTLLLLLSGCLAGPSLPTATDTTSETPTGNSATTEPSQGQAPLSNSASSTPTRFAQGGGCRIPYSAEWTQTGLFRALPSMVVGNRSFREVKPLPELPFRSESLVQKWAEGVALVSVRHGNWPEALSIAMENTQTTVSVSVPATHDAGPLMRVFLANVSAAPAQQQEAWWNAWHQSLSTKPNGQREATTTIAPPLRLEDLLVASGAVLRRPPSPPYARDVHLGESTDGWVFLFRLPRAILAEPGPDGWSLEVDAGDGAVLTSGRLIGNMTVIKENVEGVMDQLGVEPHLDDLTVHPTGSCD